MKLLSLLLTILLATGLAFSQSFQLIQKGTPLVTDTVVMGQECFMLTAYARVKNVSGVTKTNLKAKYSVIYLAISGIDTNKSRLCFGATCYNWGDTDPDFSLNNITMAPGDTNMTFTGYLDDSPTCSLVNDTIRYTIFDGNNPSDSVSWVVVYEFSTGINTVASAPKSTLVNAFPDPSDNASMINYTLGRDAKYAKITVMNMLGNKVAEYNLDTKESKFNIPTNNLNSGVYFYSLEVDGRVTSTKKLMVNH